MALLELLSAIKGRLTCFFGTVNLLIHADLGLMTTSASFNPEALAEGWQLWLAR
jgi:hypothetical protein